MAHDREKRRERPRWAWWGRPGEDVSLRHAVRILRSAGSLEELVCGGGAPLDRALRRYQQHHKAMGRSDRLLLGTAVYGLARNREALRLALPDAVPGDGHLMILALLDQQRGDPGKVPHLPEGALPWVLALERLGRLREQAVSQISAAARLSLDGADPLVLRSLSLLFSVPEWWFARGPWSTVGAAVRELSRLKRPQGLTLRAQAHRGPRDEAVQALRAEGFPARPTHRSPWGIRVEGRHNVLASPPYREGRVEVQDEGSQLVACLCDPKPGERVLDLCAGGGGKALALASMLGGKGSVIAHDVDPGRLADTRRRARRSGLGNVRAVESLSEVERLGPFGLVLVDAPCSSSGTLRRNPDVAWRWSEADALRLVAVQAELLDRAAGLVQGGGVLVYATCSLLECENGEQVRGFAARHPEFAPAPPGDRREHTPLLDVPGADQGWFRLAADLEDYEGDAFFVARFRRT